MTEMIKVKNPSKDMILWPNFLAEYCFGNVSEKEYMFHFNELDEKGKKNTAEAEKFFRRAIELGLTHELSTTENDIAPKIWAQVEKEMEENDQPN